MFPIVNPTIIESTILPIYFKKTKNIKYQDYFYQFAFFHLNSYFNILFSVLS